jgi:hypothetical protein
MKPGGRRLALRTAIALLTVLTSTLVSTMAAVSPAKAACSGSCVGQDPQATGCSTGATTLAEFTDGDIRVEMRYSSACDMAWTRATSPRHYNTTFAQIRSYDINTYARKDVAGIQVTPGTHWTVMYHYSGQWLKSCLGGWFTSDPRVCTPYR